MREKLRADEEEEKKFRRRLYEETKAAKRRIQIKIDYENKDSKKPIDDSSVKLKIIEAGYVKIRESQQTFVVLEDVFKTSSRHVLKTSSIRLQRNSFTSFKTS